MQNIPINYDLPIDKLYFDLMKSRDFKCPCGKSYLSYAALFTHIKQKHNGKAPGKITKPGSLNTKRGRPSLKSKKKEEDNQNEHENSENNQSNSSFKQYQNYNQENNFNFQHYKNNSNKKLTNDNFQQNLEEQNQATIINQYLESQALKWIQQIVKIIKQIPQKQQQINKSHLNEIQAFTQMTVILNKNLPQSYINNLITLADGLIKFFKEISFKLSWTHFKQLYILFMIFIQFIIDQQNDKSILKHVPMQIICQYVNDFYQNHMFALTEYYQLEHMSIFKQERPLRIFNGLFNWMMKRKFTTYKIEINQENSPHQDTQEEIYEKIQV